MYWVDELRVHTLLQTPRSEPETFESTQKTMRKLRIGVIDVVANSPSTTGYARVMRANLSAIMPQVIAVWCEEEGHEVHLAYHSGYENMIEELPDALDIVFIGAFTTAAHVAYALSQMYQARGCITVLGGPHARSYPEDAQKYFDYVVGFTNKELIRDILKDCSQHRPKGVHLSSDEQPETLPGLQARWKYVERLMKESPVLKIVPMIGSLGCPYTCSFCVDSIVPYQPLEFEVLKEDLRFLRRTVKKPRVGWHDPNFGVRFDDYLGAIEEAVPPGSIDFIAESTLSLLSENNVKRLKKNGFKAILPGIESWYDMGNKSKTGKTKGMDKVRRVSDQVNMISSYLPYFQANFVFGLDCDEGDEPFELTRKFLELSPGAFPAYSLLTAFGRSAPLNLEYQKEDRVIGAPFHFLNNSGVMNVRPKNYEWPDFYQKLIRLHEQSFSKKAILRRFNANTGVFPKAMNVLRGISGEGWVKIKYYKNFLNMLENDRPFRDFFEQKTTEIPTYFTDKIRRTLGPLAEWYPEEAMVHDPYAYRNSDAQPDLVQLQPILPDGAPVLQSAKN